MLMVLAGMLLAGCSGDDDEVKREAKNAEISISTNLSKMLTRVTTIDSNSELQAEDIKIDAYFHDSDTKYLDGVKLHYDSSDPAAWKFWEGDPGSEAHHFWPTETPASSLDFVGYCPYTKPSYITTGPTYSYSAGTISFASTMPTTTIEAVDYMTSDSQASMQEFLVAILKDQTYDTQTAAGGALPMEFKHSFACVKFSLSSTTTKNVTVTSITLNDLKTSGACVFDGTTSTWSSQDGSATMKLTEELHRDDTETTSPFLVIPNTYASAKTLTVNFTWREWDEEQSQSFSTSLDINWAAGHSYTYSLTITKDDLKVDVEKFTEQW